MAVRQRTGAKLSLKELDHDALVALRAKYLDLSRKYAALVERLERRTEQTTAVFRLGFWALKATASGLALVVGGTITMTNSRWARLNAPGPPWEADGEPARRSYPDLRELALGEAARLPERGAARERRGRAGVRAPASRSGALRAPPARTGRPERDSPRLDRVAAAAPAARRSGGGDLGEGPRAAPRARHRAGAVALVRLAPPQCARCHAGRRQGPHPGGAVRRRGGG